MPHLHSADKDKDWVIFVLGKSRVVITVAREREGEASDANNQLRREAREVGDSDPIGGAVIITGSELDISQRAESLNEGKKEGHLI